MTLTKKMIDAIQRTERVRRAEREFERLSLATAEELGRCEFPWLDRIAADVRAAK